MRQTLTPRTSRRLDIQGFDTVDVQELAGVAPWLRLAFGLWPATRSAACSRSWRFW
jgi:hypothetical protein